ncbi:16S rRNA (guanine(966)-N(2))-methyltransferase RsmD [Roseimicrobium sp. ORNL1]|uniref:16S rRNA (guanine(966)-N(2))-methyltransferase RsmD n=1 Tax=Roseimicrobium sp. ORNL1 TaxID=2711231 RepID=UPI0013E142B7|nr:16S rRNA (guanine(966)-N(2))-methyltransferase RsmD [Roseimicrobium sp. ORNL1]QIF02969.1 16S rRNA (guanine(966)-N(2))-methyltransferase RsmD [Roseimicrobium sp. ORNL1]
MRIIAGSAGGIPVKVPPSVTRPTTDRVREAVFSMLGESVVEARVLDLFAGSGGMGLEALSRGAAQATFVEQQGQAASIIQDNLTRSRLKGGQIVKADAFAALRRLVEGGTRFDIIFADPPYAKKPGDIDFGMKLLADENLRTVLQPGGIFVLESMVTKGGDGAIAGWDVIRDRAYGSTRILILQLPTLHDGAIPGAAALQLSPAPDVPGHGAQSLEEDESARGEGV